MSADTAGYESIRSWLNQRSGITFAEKKKDLLRHRLGRVMNRFGLKDFGELAGRLEGESNREVQLAVLHAASTHHTFFFREPQVLSFFRDHILPSLAHRERIRVWSAAASTGDEAYTLAIIAAEWFGWASVAERIAILGTDLSEPVIARAEAGIYGTNHTEHVPEPLLKRYFTRVDVDQHQVIEEMRRLCTFRRMNIKATPYPFHNTFQVIFCRNVLYYFDREHQIATLESLYDVTEPGGWLLTSVTEAVRDLGTRWQAVTSGVYRKPPCP